MKYLVTIFVALVFSQVATSKPVFNNFYQLQEGLNNAIKNAGNVAYKWTKSVAQGAMKIGEDFLQQLKKFPYDQLGSIVRKFDDISSSIDNSIRSVQEFGGNTYQRVSEEVHERMASVREKVSTSLQVAQSTYNDGSKTVTDILVKNSKKILEMESDFREEYKNAPAEYKEALDKLANDFVDKANAALSVCCQKIVISMHQMLSDTLDSIKKILPDVELAATELEMCIEESSGSQRELVKCALAAKKKIPSVGKMDDFLSNLQDEMYKYKYDDVHNSCLGPTFEGILKGRKKLEQNAEAILNNEPNGSEDEPGLGDTPSFEDEPGPGDTSGFENELGPGDTRDFEDESGPGDTRDFEDELGPGDARNFEDEPGPGDARDFEDESGPGDTQNFEDESGPGDSSGFENELGPGDTRDFEDEPGPGDTRDFEDEPGSGDTRDFEDEPGPGDTRDFEDESGPGYALGTEGEPGPEDTSGFENELGPRDTPGFGNELGPGDTQGFEDEPGPEFAYGREAAAEHGNGPMSDNKCNYNLHSDVSVVLPKINSKCPDQKHVGNGVYVFTD